MKKNLSVILAIIFMMAMVLSACGSGGTKEAASTKPIASLAPSTAASVAPAATDTKLDTSKEVKLKMIFIGPKPIDYDQVFAAINTKLKEKINATVEGEFLDWSDWTQKYPLKLAANENFDLIYAANWAGYGDQALKGGFLELTDELLSTYAPMTWEALPKVSFGQAKVDGKLYMVPQNSQESVEKVIMYREDLRKKYNLPAIDSPEAYANYLKAVFANEKGIIPFTPETGDWNLHNLDRILLK
ncbi:MAG: extracellular solute-binding protein, partial [Gorillibacterium sp.]|nr:extracellular solute-binding protein [Gorillibacterium sp.]